MEQEFYQGELLGDVVSMQKPRPLVLGTPMHDELWHQLSPSVGVCVCVCVVGGDVLWDKRDVTLCRGTSNKEREASKSCTQGLPAFSSGSIFIHISRKEQQKWGSCRVQSLFQE